ncbi:MAG TPA: hypothetical protein ENJ37_10330 [Deltaproteobacteria bacterium]|nr:hypothetical protein [Deltaproteobacteria bacterium]
MSGDRKIPVSMKAQAELMRLLVTLAGRLEAAARGLEAARRKGTGARGRRPLRSTGALSGGLGSVTLGSVTLAADVKPDPLTKAVVRYEARLEALRLFKERELRIIERADAAALEKHRRREDLITQYQAAQQRLRLDMAAAGAAQMANFMQNLYVATGKRHRAMFEAGKALAVAETVINTYRAAQGAYAALAGIPFVGPALAAAAAASAIAAGLARVRQIKETKMGGSAVSAAGKAQPGYGGGSAGAGTTPQPVYSVPAATSAQQQPTQNITIHITNPLGSEDWDRIVEDNIVPAIRRAADRNISIKVI